MSSPSQPTAPDPPAAGRPPGRPSQGPPEPPSQRPPDPPASRRPERPSDRLRYRGLLIDVGGVLTTNLFAAVDAHCRRLGLPPGRFIEVITTDPVGRRLYREIERGAISQREFERGLAERLGVDGDGLLRGLLRDARPNLPLLAAVQRARRAGIRAGVISNSWGVEPYNPYEALELAKRFDAVVISGEVGLRKPDPAIYRLGAERLGLPTAACVFVDDLDHNLPPARALGMATIHHVDTARTLRELGALLRIDLGPLAPAEPGVTG